MKKYLLFLVPLLLGLSLLTFFTQCSDDEYNPELFKPDSHGETGSLLIVLEKEFWDGALDKAIQDKFEESIMTLPRPEKMFSVQISNRKSFTQGLKTKHSIIIFDVEDNATNRNARLEGPIKDLWAKNQLVYKIRASSQSSALKIFNQYGDRLVKEYNEYSRDRLMTEYKAKKSSAVSNSLLLGQNMDLNVPSGVSVEENLIGFAWLKRFRTKWEEGSEHEIQQGILIYSYPYENDSTFTYEFQINKRDSILKKSVPGPKEGTYMATEKTPGVEPVSAEKMYNGTYVFEMRGLWKVEGDLMGGPFISISVYDEPRKRIVTLDSYVYAPHFDKRELIREMEAMIYSFKFQS